CGSGSITADPNIIAGWSARRAILAIELIRAIGTIPATATVLLIALGDRILAAALLAFIVRIEERAFSADDSRAMVAIGLVAVLAGQRTNARRLLLDGVERVIACGLGIEIGLGIAVELRQRPLRGRIPVAVGVSLETADAAQFALHGLREI